MANDWFDDSSRNLKRDLEGMVPPIGAIPPRKSRVIVAPQSSPAKAKVDAAKKPKVDAPKPQQLFSISYRVNGQPRREYVSAIDRKDAIVVFHARFSKEAQKANDPIITHVPNEWNIRWPVMWERISNELVRKERARLDELAKWQAAERKKQHIEYLEWVNEFSSSWAPIAEDLISQNEAYKLHLKLQAAVDEKWQLDWVKFWTLLAKEIEYNDDQLIRFRYIEVD